MVALFAVLVVRDASSSAGLFGAVQRSPGSVVAMWLAPMLALAILVQLVCARCGRRLDRDGSWTNVSLAERTLAWSRICAVLLHAIGVLVLGTLDLVRSAIGDVILLDELLVMLPPMLVFSSGWWSFFPIERRLREASIIRDLDSGRTMYPAPTRRQFVISNVRHQVLLSLVPLCLIATWSESMNWLISQAVQRTGDPGVFGLLGAWLERHHAHQAVATLSQLGGAIVIFALSPLVMAFVWDTVRLGPGPTRDRLLAMADASGVRVRDLLVWRTNGSMINGAVMGLVGPVRYILLTDALLDQLPERQVEAVMAHELAHAKCGHLPWLGASMLACAGGLSGVATLALVGMASLGVSQRAFVERALTDMGGEMVLSGLVLVASFVCVGFVSRRFEWQADAFAAKQLSKALAVSGENQGVVSEEGARSMAGALGAVAYLNHIAPERSSFRHGSIALRQRRLIALIGTPVDKLPIDRSARALKLAVSALLVVLIVGSVIPAAWYPAWTNADSMGHTPEHALEAHP